MADEISSTEAMSVTSGRVHSGWALLGLAGLALAGLVVAGAVMSKGSGGIIHDFGVEGTLFGAIIATLVLSIENIVLTTEPVREGAPQIGVGNVIGSVVFCVTGKLGIVLLAGGTILVDDHVLTWHVPALFVLTAFSAFALRAGRLKQWHRIVLLVAYIVCFVISFVAFCGRHRPRLTARVRTDGSPTPDTRRSETSTRPATNQSPCTGRSTDLPVRVCLIRPPFRPRREDAPLTGPGGPGVAAASGPRASATSSGPGTTRVPSRNAHTRTMTSQDVPNCIPHVRVNFLSSMHPLIASKRPFASPCRSLTSA